MEKKIIKNSKILEDNTKIKKYNKNAYKEKKKFSFIDKGIKERRLISKPIQILNQEEEEILIIVPKTREIKNSNLKEFFKI